jgi:hypothetical protein
MSVEIGGRQLRCPLPEFETRCLIHIEEEHRKANPDNALIALLCDAVRLAREYGDYAVAISTANVRNIVAAANAVPRLIAEKETLLKRIEDFRVGTHRILSPSAYSSHSQIVDEKHKIAREMLAADDAAAKEPADD